MLSLLLCAPGARRPRALAMAEALARHAGARVLTCWADSPYASGERDAAAADGAVFLDCDPETLSSRELAVPGFHLYSAAYLGRPLRELADWHGSRGGAGHFERMLPSLAGHAAADWCLLPPAWTGDYDAQSPFLRSPRPSLGVQLELCLHSQVRALQREYLLPGRRSFDLVFALETRTHVDLVRRVRGLWGWYAPAPALPGLPAWSFELSLALFAGARVFAHQAPPGLEGVVQAVSGLDEVEAGLGRPGDLHAPDRELFEELGRGFARQVMAALSGGTARRH